MSDVSDGATEAELAAVEAALGMALPTELRTLLAQGDGMERWFGDVFLMIYSTEAMVAVNHEVDRHPGFLAFGSDGSREIIGFDMRASPPPVVMIDITSAGWEDAMYQAASLDEFMAQRLRGEPFLWE